MSLQRQHFSTSTSAPYTSARGYFSAVHFGAGTFQRRTFSAVHFGLFWGVGHLLSHLLHHCPISQVQSGLTCIIVTSPKRQFWICCTVLIKAEGVTIVAIFFFSPYTQVGLSNLCHVSTVKNVRSTERLNISLDAFKSNLAIKQLISCFVTFPRQMNDLLIVQFSS